MLHIVIDSAGDLAEGWKEKYQINIIPINIHFGENTYLDGVDIKFEDFYQLVDKSGTIPKTSQPTPQQFIEFYKKIANPGDLILSVHITSKLSGTFESAQLAARELEGEYQVLTFDSGSGSAAMGYMCREARLLEQAGRTIDQIIQRLRYIREHISIILTLNTLDYARMSGRVNTLQAAMASMLNVKPVIILKDGVLEMADKVRTRSKSLEYILDLTYKRFGNRLLDMAVVHARDKKGGEGLFEIVKDQFNLRNLIMTDLSLAVAANLGPGTVGIVAYPVEGH